MTLPALAHAHYRHLAFQAAEEVESKVPRTSTAVATSGAQGQIVGLRADDAHRNDPIVHNAISQLRDALRGPLRIQSSDQAATTAFKNWSKNCGHGLQFGTLAQVWTRVCHELVTDGEVYAERRQNRQRAGHPNGLLLRVWSRQTVARELGIDGHEFDGEGFYLGTYFRGPAVEPQRGITHREVVFIPADNLVPFRLIYNAEATQGYLITAAALKSAAIQDRMALSEMRAAQTNANLAAIVITDRPRIDGRVIEPGNIDTTISSAEGDDVYELESAVLAIAHGASDVKQLAKDNFLVDYGAGTARTAAGMNLSRELIGGSSSEASFSAMRAAIMGKRATVDALRTVTAVGEGLERVLSWWREAELLAGRNWANSDIAMMPPRIESEDEFKQNKAWEIQHQNGVLSTETWQLMVGLDPFQERARGAAPQAAPQTSETPRLELVA